MRRDGSRYAISAVRDITTGYDSSFADLKARLPVSRDGQMITFTLANGIVFTLRTSGTEPKLKYYVEHCGRPDDQRDWDDIRAEVVDVVEAIIEQLIQPERNRLTIKKDVPDLERIWSC